MHTLTVLSAGSQQVDDVLVFTDHLHHFHFRDQVRQVLLCGIHCTTSSHDFSFMLSQHVSILNDFIWNLPLSIFTATFVRRVGLFLSTPIASAKTTWPKQPSPRGFPRVSLRTTGTTVRVTTQWVLIVRLTLLQLCCDTSMLQITGAPTMSALVKIMLLSSAQKLNLAQSLLQPNIIQ